MENGVTISPGSLLVFCCSRHKAASVCFVILPYFYCLELSVCHYHHHIQGTSENRTVRCCIRLGLTFLLPPAPPIRTLDIRCRLLNVFDSDIDILLVPPIYAVQAFAVSLRQHHSQF